MKKLEIVLITGMSGAGKTTAMAVFENLKYQCIDNYPIELLENFIQLTKTTEKYTQVALAVSLKYALDAYLIITRHDWIKCDMIFLDSTDDILLKRYKQTRRTHPLLINGRAATLTEAISMEREFAENVKLICSKVLDTSMVKPNKFQEMLETYYFNSDLTEQEALRITFISFGYKHGIPKDLDLMFDVRFLPNPYYVDELREGTGNDDNVYHYVIDKPETEEYINHLTPTLSYLFNEFEKEGRDHLVVGFGCTGGQHRSVSLTNYFADYYSSFYQVNRLHRDAKH